MNSVHRRNSNNTNCLLQKDVKAVRLWHGRGNGGSRAAMTDGRAPLGRCYNFLKFPKEIHQLVFKAINYLGAGKGAKWVKELAAKPKLEFDSWAEWRLIPGVHWPAT